jgi:hypothetical protein
MRELHRASPVVGWVGRDAGFDDCAVDWVEDRVLDGAVVD